MLHGVKFGNFAEAHDFRLAERLVGQKLIQFIERLRTRDQDAAAGWNRRSGYQETAFVIALLQELAMRRNKLRRAFLEWNEMLSFEQKVFHRATLQVSVCHVDLQRWQ
jgi:hypothetical protein